MAGRKQSVAFATRPNMSAFTIRLAGHEVAFEANLRRGRVPQAMCGTWRGRYLVRGLPRFQSFFASFPGGFACGGAVQGGGGPSALSWGPHRPTLPVATRLQAPPSAK